MLGLPADVTACLFDLDGVLTQTARVHNAAWTQIFNDFLRERAVRTGREFQPFDPGPDYTKYVDGKPRADGVRSFLASRGITLPEGSPADPPEADTVYGIATRKNAILIRRIHEDGVQVYDGSVAYLRAAQRAGLHRAVVTASANSRDVLAAAGIADLFEVVVDGVVARQKNLRGKPCPDTFLVGARMLGVTPAQAAVFEDALAGVQAGRAGGFGCVVGVDRANHPGELLAHGAQIVVRDLADLLHRNKTG